MSKLVTIDPGNASGCAIFFNGVLAECGLIHCISGDTREYTKSLFALCDNIKPDAMIVEIPQVYQQKHWKGDPNDLIHVATLSGICIAAGSPFCAVKTIVPHKWKGSRPKDVDTKYTNNLLNEIEKDVLKKAKIKSRYEHNVLDAIGIGLWWLQRR